MRRPIIAGNWKMHKTPEEAAVTIKELAPLVKDTDVEVVICAPFTSLQAVRMQQQEPILKLALRICIGKKRAHLPVKYLRSCLMPWA